MHAADSFDFNEELLNKSTFIVINFVICYKFGIKEHRKVISSLLLHLLTTAISSFQKLSSWAVFMYFCPITKTAQQNGPQSSFCSELFVGTIQNNAPENAYCLKYLI